MGAAGEEVSPEQAATIVTPATSIKPAARIRGERIWLKATSALQGNYARERTQNEEYLGRGIQSASQTTTFIVRLLHGWRCHGRVYRPDHLGVLRLIWRTNQNAIRWDSRLRSGACNRMKQPRPTCVLDATKTFLLAPGTLSLSPMMHPICGAIGTAAVGPIAIAVDLVAVKTKKNSWN